MASESQVVLQVLAQVSSDEEVESHLMKIVFEELFWKTRSDNK
jgi:hypothetical protein